MPNNVTTVHGGGLVREVIDATVHPKRFQNQIAVELGTATVNEEGKVVPHVPQSNITLEKAITWYREQATGEFAGMYGQTANWLTELLKKKGVAVGDATQGSSDTSGQTEPKE
jgi:hypothetical protein